MTADLPALWLSAPEGFTAVDLAGAPGDRMDRLADGLNAVFPTAAPERRLSLAVAAELALRAHLREGAVHLSARLARASDGTPVLGVFTVFVRREDLGPPGSYPRRAAERLAAAWPRADVGVLELPPGRTVVAVRDVPVPGPAATTVRQVEFLVPHPWSPHVVAAVFTTEQAEYWEEWLPALAAAVGRISFHPPENGDPGAPGQRDRIREAFG